MSEEIATIDIKEFREKGYLQELNRRFLHPLGLALSIEIDEDGNEQLKNVWDYRDDPEGIYYDLQNSKQNRIEEFEQKKKFIDSELSKRSDKRAELFGSLVEPITNKLSKDAGIMQNFRPRW